MSVQIEDPVHGRLTFEEPVLCELLESPPMRRIRDVDTGGYSRGFFPGCGFSRFEHSVGVCHLLSVAGASLAEQIHGLLHDVNHSVFSHAIDYVPGRGSEERQSYQDDHFAGFVMSSCLPSVLEKHGFDPAFIIDESHFPLEEQPLPDPCADRLDYSLRSLLHYGLMDLDEISALLAQLKCDGDVWFFSDRRSAARFAEAFSAVNERVFSSFRSGVMYRAVGDCVGYALREGVLTTADLLSTDSEVVGKLEATQRNDGTLHTLWERMNGRVSAVPSNRPGALDAHCKSRVVDPLFASGDGTLQRLGDADPSWRRAVEAGMQPKRYRFEFEEAGPSSGMDAEQ